MTRTQPAHRNASHRVLLLALMLAWPLVVAAGTATADPQVADKQILRSDIALKTPILFNVLSNPAMEVYVADKTKSPGAILELGVAPYPLTRFARPRGRITSLAVGLDGWFYYSDASAYFILRTDGRVEYEVHRHSTYVRDVGFDATGRLYFSEATGAGGDGMIYRLSPDHVVSEPFLRVPLAEVGGYWAGHFAFDRSGVLHVSSGNRRPSSLYAHRAGRFVEVFAQDMPITGIAFRTANQLLFTEQGQRLMALDNFTSATVDTEDERLSQLTDVATTPKPSGGGCTISGRLVGGEALRGMAHVNALGPDFPWRWVEGVRPGSDGRYTVSAPPGRYRVRVDLSGGTTRQFGPRERTVDCRGAVSGIDFTYR